MAMIDTATVTSRTVKPRFLRSNCLGMPAPPSEELASLFAVSTGSGADVAGGFFFIGIEVVFTGKEFAIGAGGAEEGLVGRGHADGGVLGGHENDQAAPGIVQGNFVEGTDGKAFDDVGELSAGAGGPLAL